MSNDTLEIEAIKQLKYRYFRALDSKNWTLMGECLTNDATAHYDSGKYSFDGKEKILSFFREFMDSPSKIPQHHGHHPEITITSQTTAEGVWYLQDFFIDLDAGTTLRGAGFYSDQYVKIDGQWKIKSTGYERTYEEIEQRSPNVKITRSMYA